MILTGFGLQPSSRAGNMWNICLLCWLQLRSFLGIQSQRRQGDYIRIARQLLLHALIREFGNIPNAIHPTIGFPHRSKPPGHILLEINAPTIMNEQNR